MNITPVTDPHRIAGGIAGWNRVLKGRAPSSVRDAPDPPAPLPDPEATAAPAGLLSARPPLRA